MGTFGERILLLRRRRDLTQRALAQMAGLNSNTLARVERGEVKDLVGQSVARLAQGLETSTDYLLGLTDDPTPREEPVHAGHAL